MSRWAPEVPPPGDNPAPVNDTGTPVDYRPNPTDIAAVVARAGHGLGADSIKTAIESYRRRAINQAIKQAVLEALAASGELDRVAETAFEEAAKTAGDVLAEPEPDHDEVQDPAPVYDGVEDFVTDYLLPHWRHPHGKSTRWCPHWFEHAEAITTLTALWTSWEHLRRDPFTGVAVWLRDYAYPLLGQLTSPEGTFAKCNIDMGRHELVQLWPTQPVPRGLLSANEQANDPQAPTNEPEVNK